MPFLWEIGPPTFSLQIRNYTCHSCGRAGHITDACKSKLQKVHKVEETEASEVGPSSVDPFSISLYNLVTETKGIEIPVELNGTSLLMELDTGAGVSRHIQQVLQRNPSQALQHAPAHLHRAPSPSLWSTPGTLKVPRSECRRPTYGS